MVREWTSYIYLTGCVGPRAYSGSVRALSGARVCQKERCSLCGACVPLASHVLLVAQQELVLICAQWLSTSLKGRQPAWNLVVSPTTLWRVPIPGAHATTAGKEFATDTFAHTHMSLLEYQWQIDCATWRGFFYGSNWSLMRILSVMILYVRDVAW